MSLKDQQSDEDHNSYTLLRQNEPDNITIYVRLPERGLYALELFGRPRGTDGTDVTSPPHIATYLIAATTVPDNVQPYPAVTNQTTGQNPAYTQ